MSGFQSTISEKPALLSYELMIEIWDEYKRRNKERPVTNTKMNV